MDIDPRSTALTPIQTACLVAAPLTLALGRTQLNLNWDDAPDYLAEMAANPVSTDLGSLLTLAGSILLIPAVLGLAGIVRIRTPRLAAVGGALAVLGAISGIVVATTALVGGHIAEQATNAATAELWTGIWSDSRVGPPLLIAGIIGFVLLAVGLFRSGVVPRTAAVLVGVGAVATLVTSVGPVRALVVGSAVLTLAAFGWIAVAIRAPQSLATRT
jgi:hypothetical protein